MESVTATTHTELSFDTFLHRNSRNDIRLQNAP